MSAQECKVAFRVNFRHFMRELYGTVVLAENICGVCNWISGELFPTPGMVGGGLRLRGGGAGERERSLMKMKGVPTLYVYTLLGLGVAPFCDINDRRRRRTPIYHNAQNGRAGVCVGL